MKNKWIRLFVNPFEDVASNRLLIIGLIAYVLSSLLVYYTSNHFQGIISIKAGSNSGLLWSFYNNGIAILSLSLVSFVFGKTRNSHVRFIDVFNVVLISRIVLYIILLLLIEPVFVKNVLIKVELAILDDDFILNTLNNWDRCVLICLGMAGLFGLFYYFYFLIKGLRFVFNSKRKMDILWILLLVFGLEIVFTLFGINIY